MYLKYNCIKNNHHRPGSGSTTAREEEVVSGYSQHGCLGRHRGGQRLGEDGSVRWEVVLVVVVSTRRGVAAMGKGVRQRRVNGAATAHRE